MSILHPMEVLIFESNGSSLTHCIMKAYAGKTWHIGTTHYISDRVTSLGKQINYFEKVALQILIDDLVSASNLMVFTFVSFLIATL